CRAVISRGGRNSCWSFAFCGIRLSPDALWADAVARKPGALYHLANIGCDLPLAGQSQLPQPLFFAPQRCWACERVIIYRRIHICRLPSRVGIDYTRRARARGGPSPWSEANKTRFLRWQWIGGIVTRRKVVGRPH